MTVEKSTNSKDSDNLGLVIYSLSWVTYHLKLYTEGLEFFPQILRGLIINWTRLSAKIIKAQSGNPDEKLTDL